MGVAAVGLLVTVVGGGVLAVAAMAKTRSAEIETAASYEDTTTTSVVGGSSLPPFAGRPRTSSTTTPPTTAGRSAYGTRQTMPNCTCSAEYRGRATYLDNSSRVNGTTVRAEGFGNDSGQLFRYTGSGIDPNAALAKFGSYKAGENSEMGRVTKASVKGNDGTRDYVQFEVEKSGYTFVFRAFKAKDGTVTALIAEPRDAEDFFPTYRD